MPFKSEKQKKFLYAKHPKIAEKWSKEAKQTPKHAAIKRRLEKRSK